MDWLDVLFGSFNQIFHRQQKQPQKQPQQSTQPTKAKPQPARSAQPTATTTYYVAGTDEKGKTVVKEIKNPSKTAEEWKKAPVVAKGPEADAMVTWASAEIQGRREGYFGTAHHRSVHRAIQQYQRTVQKVNQLQKQAEQLQAKQQELAAERAQLEKMAPTSPGYQQRIAAYNEKVNAYNALVQKYQTRAQVMNQALRTSYLNAYRVQGYEAGVRYGENMRPQPSEADKMADWLIKLHHQEPLKAFALDVSSSLLSSSDPLGLGTIGAYISAEAHGKTHAEAVRAAVKKKAEAILELEQVRKKGELALFEHGATGPFATAAVGSIAVGGAAGAAVNAAERTSVWAGRLAKFGLAGAGVYYTNKNVIQPIRSGNFEVGLPNFILTAASLPGFSYGYKAGYGLADRAIDAVSIRLAQAKSMAQINAVNDTIEGAGIEPPKQVTMPRPAQPASAEPTDFYERILRLPEYKLKNIDTSRMVRAYEILLQRGQTKKAAEIMDRIQAIEAVKAGEAILTLPKRTTPRTVTYDAWTDQMLQSGREYYSGVNPARVVFKELTIKKTLTPRPSVVEPRAYAPRLSYFSRGEDMIPASILGLDKMADLYGPAEVRDVMPRFPPVAPSAHGSVRQALSMRSKPATSQRLGLRLKSLLRTDVVQRMAQLQVRKQKVRTITITRPRPAQAARTQEQYRQRTVSLARTILRDIELPMEKIRPMAIQLQKYIPITTPPPPPAQQMPDFMPQVLFHGKGHRIRIPRRRSVRVRLPRLRIIGVKSILPDPISKMLTELRTGRPALAPLPTPRLWNIAERSLYEYVPTAEMMRRRRKKYKSRRR